MLSTMEERYIAVCQYTPNASAVVDVGPSGHGGLHCLKKQFAPDELGGHANHAPWGANASSRRPRRFVAGKSFTGAVSFAWLLIGDQL
jgi:hypothetical protein